MINLTFAQIEGYKNMFLRVEKRPPLLICLNARLNDPYFLAFSRLKELNDARSEGAAYQDFCKKNGFLIYIPDHNSYIQCFKHLFKCRIY